MRTILVLLSLGALTLSGLASAAPKTGEETLALDLSVIPGGATYFLKCSRSASLTDCGLVSLWQQSNGVTGLQTGMTSFHGPRQPDSALLP